MGIVKISEDLHEHLRVASNALSRSINAQANFWIKIGMLCELHPELGYQQIVAEQLRSAGVQTPRLAERHT